MPGRSLTKRVLYLSYDGLTDPLGQSQILPYMCGLAKHGYSIAIVTFEKRHRLKEIGSAIKQTCLEHNIQWEPLVYHKRPAILSTVYDLFILRRAVKRMILKGDISIVHCRSYLTAMVGCWAKRRFGVKFLFDIRGFWVDERVEGGIWDLRNPVYKIVYHFFKAKEKKLFRNADHVVSLTESAKNEIESWSIVRSGITVIPTCVDMRLFDPARTGRETRDLRKVLSINEEEFVLAYAGSWGSWYLTHEILEFYSVLASVGSKTRLLVLTPDEPDLSEYPFKHQVIVRNVPRKDMPAYLGLAKASICFIKPAFSKKASSATKIAEAWAMNLPVVTNRGWGDIQNLYDLGMPLVLCDSKSDYRRVASALLNLSPVNKRDALIGNFDLDAGVHKFAGIYRYLEML